MSAGPLVFEIISVFFLVLTLLHRYADFKKQNKFTLIGTFIAWYFSLLIVVLLPLDISMTTYRQCLQDKGHSSSSSTASTTFRNLNDTLVSEDVVGFVCKEPWSLVSPRVFPVLWRIIYWSSQILTWLILPFMQAFSQSGEFTLSGKMRGALIANAIYYGTYLAVFGVLLIYVAIKHNIDGQKLKVIGITASNTWGLFLLILLLGYGLVAVPRSLWFRSITPIRLQRIYFKIAKLHSEKCEAEENLEDILNEVKSVAEKIKYNHPLRYCIDLIVKKCPDSFRASLRRNVEDFVDYNNDCRDVPSDKCLVGLHSRLLKALQVNTRVNNQWTHMMHEAFRIEDILTNERNTNHKFVYTVPHDHSTIYKRACNPTLEWIYKCVISKYMLRTVSVIFAAITVVVVWSEMTFFNKKPVLSIFAIILNSARETYNYFSVELFCLLIISYLCFCAYYTIFKMRIFNFYYLANNHQTDEYSLIFSGNMLCRLTAPLCYNFLGLVHLDSHITKDPNILETQFTSLMGHMDVISFISDGFNIYFPMLILLFCLATFFNLGGRTLNFFGFEQFVGDADITQDLIEDGKNLISRERRRIQRNDPEVQSRHRSLVDRLKSKVSGRDTGASSSSLLDSSASSFRNRDDNNNSAFSKSKIVVSEYRDNPNEDETNQLFSSNSRASRLFNDDPVDYESTSANLARFPNTNNSMSAKNMRGIFDDV